MDALDRRLLDEFQRAFPLSPRPYAVLGERLGVAEAEVRRRLSLLQGQGVVSRVGAVFRPHSVGQSTLAALAVPDFDVERVAAIVNAFPEVNHNYLREHVTNIWFVVAAESVERVRDVLDAIHAATGYPPLDLPMIEDFHIDLGFPLQWT
ncbi:MAG TPA: AsnC family transcriptional regulator [Patescibacteria group bacterium]|nr:AsnC family transcriptional regulator [Patescibacteria group bacterium]